MKIITTFSSAGWDQFRTNMARLGDEGPTIMAGMLNEGGSALRAKTVSAETRQTNLSHDTLERAQVATEAAPGRLSFVTTVEGGNVRLKYFGAKESGSGVTASPWGKATFYPGAFINSGFRGKRAPSPKLGGQVYRRAGAKNLPIGQVRSGLFLPDELLKGATVQAFDSGAPMVLDGILTKLAAMI
jgi:hypothetical protein